MRHLALQKLVIILVMLSVGTTTGFTVSVQSTRLPHPVQFTENKGQWDSSVLYKCEVRHDGFTWFLERDGVTLVTSVIDSSSLVGAVREPPVSLNDKRFDPDDRIQHRRLKSHALKFKFIDSRRGEPQSARRRQSHSPLSDQDAPTNLGAFAPTGRMRYAPTDKCTTQEDVGINSDLPFAQAKWIDAQGELSWHNNYFLGNDSSKWAPDCRNFTRVVYHDVWQGIDVECYESKGHLEFDFVVHPGADPKQIRMVCEGLEAPIAGGGRTLLSVDSIISITNRSRTGVSDLRLSNELSLPTSLGELRMKIPGAYQTTANGTSGNAVTAQFRLVSENLFTIDLPNGYDASQTLRIDPLVYSTYIGSSGGEIVNGLTNIDNSSIVATGVISGDPQNFPVTPGAFDTTLNGSFECFVVRLNISNSQLEFCTIIGGSGMDIGYGIVNDGNEGSVIAGETSSSNFPHTNGIQLWGGSDFFLTRLNNTGSRLIYSTLFGGSNFDGATGLSGDGEGGAIICGHTISTDFPIIIDCYDTSYNGYYDGFITHINGSATNFTVSTYIGGSSYEHLFAISRDSSSIQVTGQTSSHDYPTTSSAFDTIYHRNGNDSMDCIVSRFDLTGDHLLASSYLGGNGDDCGTDIKIGNRGDIFVSGCTTSPDFPVTSGSLDTVYQNKSGFITKLDSSLHSLTYSTFIGFSSYVRILNDNNDGLFITGNTDSSFITTAGSFDESYNGDVSDAFIAHLSSAGNCYLYSSFLGGSGQEMGKSIVKLENGNIVVGGWTSSINFPITNNGFDTTYNGGLSDCFITYIRIDTSEVSRVFENLPLKYILLQNYPNPFNATTTLSYSLPITSHVDLRLYDLMGREVSTLVQREQRAGTYRVLLDGSRLASGTYFVRLQAGTFSKTQKIVLLK